MKYYAVTDDPNELLHYGVKGMKWGQHLFGDDLKPKSAGYKRALGKLRDKAKIAKSAIQKSATQKAINKQKKQESKYNKAVENAQRRINAIEGLNSLNRAKNLDRIANREQKEAQRYEHNQIKLQKYNAKAERKFEKQEIKYAKNEKRMDKYLQQARHGKLKYGKLSDEQVQQITDRLNMERVSRNLGGAEKTWRQQKKEALRRGKLSGIERGTAAAMEEVARAGVIYGIQGLMNRKKREALAKQQGKENKIKNKEQNKKTHKEIRDDVREEMYEEAVKSGENRWQRRNRLTTAGAARHLKDIKNANLEEDRKRKALADVKTERDKEFYKLTESGKYDVDSAKDIKDEYQKAFGADAAKETFGLRNRKFKKLSEEEKRNMVLDVQKAKDKKEKQESFEKYNEYREIQEENRRAEQGFQKAMDAYWKRLAEYEKNPNGKKRPVKPSRSNYYKGVRKVPTINYELFDNFSSLGTPSIYQGQGGGGGGGNKKS